MRDASYWVKESNGLVRAAITLRITKSAIKIKRCVLDGDRMRTAQEVSIHKSPRGRMSIRGGPLIILFVDLFLRQPAGTEEDIAFEPAELELLARESLQI